MPLQKSWQKLGSKLALSFHNPLVMADKLAKTYLNCYCIHINGLMDTIEC